MTRKSAPPAPRPPEASTVLLYAVMVMITGSFFVTTDPSAFVGRIRSPRSTVPSSIGIAMSVTVVVPAYCAGRGFQRRLFSPDGADATAGAAAGAPTGPTAASADCTSGAGPRTRPSSSADMAEPGTPCMSPVWPAG